MVKNKIKIGDIKLKDVSNRTNKVVYACFDFSINDKYKDEGRIIKQVNDLHYTDDEIKLQFVMLLIDTFLTVNRLNGLENIEDIEEFLFEYGYNNMPAIKAIKEIYRLKNFYNSLNLPVEEADNIYNEYIENDEKITDDIKKFIYKYFEFE